MFHDGYNNHKDFYIKVHDKYNKKTNKHSKMEMDTHYNGSDIKIKDKQNSSAKILGSKKGGEES